MSAMEDVPDQELAKKQQERKRNPNKLKLDFDYPSSPESLSVLVKSFPFPAVARRRQRCLWFRGGGWVQRDTLVRAGGIDTVDLKVWSTPYREIYGKPIRNISTTIL